MSNVQVIRVLEVRDGKLYRSYYSVKANTTGEAYDNVCRGRTESVNREQLMALPLTPCGILKVTKATMVDWDGADLRGRCLSCAQRFFMSETFPLEGANLQDALAETRACGTCPACGGLVVHEKSYSAC